MKNGTKRALKNAKRLKRREKNKSGLAANPPSLGAFVAAGHAALATPNLGPEISDEKMEEVIDAYNREHNGVDR